MPALVRVLITGGAGFIGSHLADALLARGYEVRALDNLLPQVHGDGQRPAYLNAEVDLHVGDVRDDDAVTRALSGVDAVVHFAARVGVGQSMYEMAEYTDVNSRGTAVLLEALRRRPIQKLMVASSMSVYGEGTYVANGREVASVERSRAQLARGEWDPHGPKGEVIEPIPTHEGQRPTLSSIYALGKYDQERMFHLFGNAHGIPTVALRLFNVYGPRQALSNPYTGVLAIFAARLLNGRPPMVFEDGEQRRDFVHVDDVTAAAVLALESEQPDGGVFNVGSGESVSVRDVAERLARALGSDVLPEVTGRYRVGDIRHCFADIELARRTLGYEPHVRREEGMAAHADWLAGQVAVDRVDSAAAELAAEGLML